VLIAAALVYAAIAGVMYASQTAMLFPTGMVPGSPAVLPAGAERLRLAAKDGDTLAGLRLPGPDERAPLVLGFGGNAWNADHLAVFLRELSPDAEIVTFHYRGYRPSTGKPSAAAILEDAGAIHDALVPQGSVRRVYAVGLSLGAGIAAHLARERPLAGLVLVSPFDSLAAVAQGHYVWLPVRLLFRHDIDAARAMAAHERPTALIRAERDTIVPPRRTEALLPAIRRLVRHHVIAGADHNDLYDRSEFATAYRDAFAAVRTAGDQPSPGR
jgi:pimeloyl-ACP methyl ester carboxylesterase